MMVKHVCAEGTTNLISRFVQERDRDGESSQQVDEDEQVFVALGGLR